MKYFLHGLKFRSKALNFTKFNTEKVRGCIRMVYVVILWGSVLGVNLVVFDGVITLPVVQDKPFINATVNQKCPSSAFVLIITSFPLPVTTIHSPLSLPIVYARRNIMIKRKKRKDEESCTCQKSTL